MSVLRNKLDRDFTKIPTAAIIDDRITAGAFRVLMYLFSKPDNWQVNNNEIKSTLKISRAETIAKYWKELINTGWIDREAKTENGKFTGGYDYELNTEPKYGLTGIRENRNTENTEIRENRTYNKTDLINKTEIEQDGAQNALSPAQIKFQKRIGKKQFDLLKEDPETFGQLSHAKKLLFAEWLEHRNEIKKPCGTMRVLKTQFSYFLNNSETKCREAVDVAISSGVNGWIDIRFGFKEVERAVNGSYKKDEAYKPLKYENA